MKVSLWAEIHRLYEIERLSKRAIVQQLRCCHTTVSKALAMEEPPSQVAKPLRKSKLDPYKKKINRLTHRYPRLSAVRVLDEISKGRDGYQGGITLVKDYLRTIRPARHEVAERELKAWLCDIILSKVTPQNVRTELALQHLDCISEIARHGPMAARKRALAVLACAKGYSASLVARCLNTSRSTVSKANKEVKLGKEPNGLLRKPSGQRNCDDHRRMANALIEILHHKPREYGINRSNWTRQSLADAYEKHYGQRISGTTVGQRLKEAGYSRKNSRQVLTSPDPRYREKVELLLATLHSLNADEMFFFIDELGPLQVKRYGGRSYTPRKETPTHPQSQRSKGSIILHAALSATTNELTWVYGDAKDSFAMIDLVELLFNQYHDKTRLYITWDAASWHSSNLLRQWVDELNARNCAQEDGPIVEFVPLPRRSQFLNVIETVFSTMKKSVIHNSDYESKEEMKSVISRHFRERNEFFKKNPRRAGTKIWEIDFFEDFNNIRWGNYREW